MARTISSEASCKEERSTTISKESTPKRVEVEGHPSG